MMNIFDWDNMKQVHSLLHGFHARRSVVCAAHRLRHQQSGHDNVQHSFPQVASMIVELRGHDEDNAIENLAIDEVLCVLF